MTVWHGPPLPPGEPYKAVPNLPVIKNCGMCSRFAGDSQRERGGGWCNYGDSRFLGVEEGATNEEWPPPDWCPLRGNS